MNFLDFQHVQKSLRAAFTLVTCLALCGCQHDDTTASHELASQGIFSGALSSDGGFSLVGSLNHGASLWRNPDHERLYDWNHQAGEYSTLTAAAFSPDGSRAATADPRTLVLWDTRTGESLGFWATPGSVMSLAVLEQGRAVLMGLEDHSAVLFDPVNGAHLRTFLHQAVVGSVAASTDGSLALTGSDDETAVVWDLNTGESVHRFECGNPVRQVALSATGRYAFTAAQGAGVTLWDATTGARLADLHDRNPGVTSARFAFDESTLLIGYVNRTVELWDTRNQKMIQRWNAGARDPWRPTGAAILAVGFDARTGAYLALAGDGRLVELRRS